jgi:hypothetical protein
MFQAKFAMKLNQRSLLLSHLILSFLIFLGSIGKNSHKQRNHINLKVQNNHLFHSNLRLINSFLLFHVLDIQQIQSLLKKLLLAIFSQKFLILSILTINISRMFFRKTEFHHQASILNHSGEINELLEKCENIFFQEIQRFASTIHNSL